MSSTFLRRGAVLVAVAALALAGCSDDASEGGTPSATGTSEAVRTWLRLPVSHVSEVASPERSARSSTRRCWN